MAIYPRGAVVIIDSLACTLLATTANAGGSSSKYDRCGHGDNRMVRGDWLTSRGSRTSIDEWHHCWNTDGVRDIHGNAHGSRVVARRRLH